MQNRLPQVQCLKCWVLLLTVSLPQVLQAEGKNSHTGFIDFNLYPYLSDVSNDNTLTINAFAILDNGFSYFSLTNFGNQTGQDELADTTSYYTEQSLRWRLGGSPFDLTTQLNFRTGEDNDRHRLGIRWRLDDTDVLSPFFRDINLSYTINWHAIQIDKESGNVWQLEHAFRLKFPYLSDRLYLAGFIDHTFNQDLPDSFPDNPIVGEAQLGYRIIDNLFVVTEYRINEYRRSDVNNIAVGLEYQIKW